MKGESIEMPPHIVLADSRTVLLEKIRSKTAIVGVVGLGYVGLPFAVEKAKMGFKVIGLDRNAERVAKVNAAQNYIGDVEDAELAALVSGGLLVARTDLSALAEMDVIVMCVPTPLADDLSPDLQYVENVSRQIADFLRPGQLISLESTTYPGTTDEVILPLLQATGLKVEQDFFLCHSPERVDPGNQRYTTKNTNKVVGGVGPRSLEVAVEFYSQTILNVVPVSSARAAELTKVFENTFRAVNIALVNELAMLCDKMDLNVWEVLDAANTKPFGIMPFYPGPGVGGHCIPIDPHYLEWKAKEFGFETQFIGLAGRVNRGMPAFVVDKARRLLGERGIALEKARVLALGAAYKANLDDARESPAIDVIRRLRSEGANVAFHDSWVTGFTAGGDRFQSTDLTAEALSEADLTVILTNHSDVDYAWVVEHSAQVLDTRNATRNVSKNRERIVLL